MFGSCTLACRRTCKLLFCWLLGGEKKKENLSWWSCKYWNFHSLQEKKVLTFEKHAFSVADGKQSWTVVLEWPKEPLEQAELTSSFSQQPEKFQDRLKAC